MKYDQWLKELKTLAKKAGCLWLIGDDPTACIDNFNDGMNPQETLDANIDCAQAE